MADLDYEGIWKNTLIQLRTNLGEEEFGGWFSNLKFLRARENGIVLGAPSAFIRDKVKSRYQTNINSILKNLSDKEIAIEFEITGKNSKKDNDSQDSETQPEEKSGDSAVSSASETLKAEKKRGKNSQLRDDYTFDRFVVGENNKYAANAALAIGKNPGKTSYNPFLIFGGVGLGKTHLMQAIGNYVHENSDNKVIYVTSEDFLNEYVDSIQASKMNAFKNKYRYTDILLIDDIQFLQGKTGVQEELFHTFSALIQAKKQLVFTCDRPPSELKTFSERLVSRFGSGLMFDLQPPRYEERCAILKSTAESRNTEIPAEVIDLVSKNISSNVRDLISALNILIAYTELMGKPVTIDIAQQRLKSIFYAPKQANLSTDVIIRVVAEYFGLTPNDLKGKKRSQNIVFARQIAMYVAREMTDYSTTEVGQDFGGKDHTTVMHSIDKIKGKLLTDPTLESTIDSIKMSIKDYGAKF
jgi:chromosomal replication initiator protein